MTGNEYRIAFGARGPIRKRLVKVLADFYDTISDYAGPPTYAFYVRGITIDRDGNVVFPKKPDSPELENLLARLKDQGLTPVGTEIGTGAVEEELAVVSIEPETLIPLPDDAADQDAEMPVISEPSGADTEAEEADGEPTIEPEAEQEAEMENGNSNGLNGDAVFAPETCQPTETQETDDDMPSGCATEYEVPPSDLLSEHADTQQSFLLETAIPVDSEADTGETPPDVTVFTDASELDTATELVIDLPRSEFNMEQLANLQKMIDSKASLLKKSLGTDDLSIEITNVRVRFPWFRVHDEVEAATYSRLVSFMGKLARESKWVVGKERPVDSEKYAFRTWLVRLGFAGPAYKKDRAILMRNLSGMAAFRTQEQVNAFYRKLKQKQMARKQEKTSEHASGSEQVPGTENGPDQMSASETVNANTPEPVPGYAALDANPERTEME